MYGADARPRKLAQATDASHLEAKPSPGGLGHSARPRRRLGFILRIVALRKTRKRPQGPTRNFTKAPRFTVATHWSISVFVAAWGIARNREASDFVFFRVARRRPFVSGRSKAWRSRVAEIDSWRRKASHANNRRRRIAQAIRLATARFSWSRVSARQARVSANNHN